jgi:hypothetical protein
VTKTTIAWKVLIAVVALACSLCSACGFFFTVATGWGVWLISVPCFLIFGVAAFFLWRWFDRFGHEKQLSSPTPEANEGGATPQ